MEHQNPDSSMRSVELDHEKEPISQESYELQILPATSNEELQKDVKIDIGPKVEAEVTPWISRADRSDGVKEFKVSNCTSSSILLKFFDSPDIVDELIKVDSILLAKFQFCSNFDDIEVRALEKLNKKCRNNAVIVHHMSINSEKSLIFWKSKEIPRLLKVKSIGNMEVDKMKDFNEFAVDFLIESLKNRQKGLASTFVLQSEVLEVEVNFLADSRDFNLLLQACEKGNVNVVKIGLALGMNTTLQGSKVTAQSLALLNGHYDVILALVEANLTFPRLLDIKDCPDEFRKAHKITETLHEYIKANNVDKVKEILDVNPQKRYFYNIQNESAIKVAIQNESMEAHELLLSHKLRFGPHENPEDLLQDLSFENKLKAREIHNKHAQDFPLKHVNILMANSFICHDVEDSEAKMEIVNRAYRALNANLFIRMLLMIVAASRKFKIIFDFNRDSVSAADPTVDGNTQGLFYLSGRILIGAKQLLNETTEHEALATMAHELCHFAMYLVYGNDAKPYTPNDNLTMNEFEGVSERCRQKSEKEVFIDLIYSHYPEDMYHAELIVRVVHLVALYRNNPEKLKEVSETFSDLFEFYEKKIHPQLEQALPEVEAKAEKESDEKVQKLIYKYNFLLIFGGVLSFIRENTKNVQFVCTRPLYSQQLSNKLNSHAFTLIPLTESQQTEFLNKFFISENVTEQTIPVYMKRIENIISKLDKKLQNFGSPLMLVMFGTIITNDAEIYESENIFQIYEKFIKIKIEIWQKTELGLKYVENSYGSKFSMLDMFFRYSLKRFYTITVNFPNLKLMRVKVPKELTDDEVSRTGILYLNGPQNYEFAHKTFEEFFVAKFLVDNIFRDDDELTVVEAETVVDILFFYIEISDYYDVIFKFLMSYAQAPISSKKLNPKIDKVLRSKHKEILINLISRITMEKLNFILDFFRADRTLLLDLLDVHQNETFYTALFNPFYYGFNLPDLLIKNKQEAQTLFKKHLKEGEYEKFLMAKIKKDFFYLINFSGIIINIRYLSTTLTF